MKGLLAILFGVVATLVAVPSLAAAQSAPVGKKGEVELTTATKVGATTLHPGLYRFHHELVGGQHFVVIEDRATMHHGGHLDTATAKGEVARVACKVVDLPGKVRQTLVTMTKGADGSWVITEMRIRDERMGHVLVLAPAG